MTSTQAVAALELLPRVWRAERVAAAHKVLAARDAGLWAHLMAVSLQVNARGEGR